MESKRNVYLNMKTLEETRKIVDEQFPVSGILTNETIAVPEAVGRVLAEPVYARLSSPHFNAAAMDGLAVKAQISFGASEAAPRTLVIGKDVFAVNTGHVMPPDCDAVIMIENVLVLDDTRVQIDKPVFPWQNVR